jgi:hypothetical protein
MNKDNLRRFLVKKSVLSHFYNMDGIGETDQRICLEFDHTHWIVYYSEHGMKFDIKQFSTEDEACRDMLSRLTDE